MKKSLGAKVVPVNAPAWLIGSYDADGRPNAATVAWAGICCSKPPCVNFSLRQATYSHGCILRSGCFTVSVTNESQVVATDFFGIYSGRDNDKFEATGLTPVKAEHVEAPYVDEAPLVLECKLIKHVELGLHTLFVGEILDAKCEAELLDEKDTIDVARLKPIVYGSGQYWSIGACLGKGHSIGNQLTGGK